MEKCTAPLTIMEMQIKIKLILLFHTSQNSYHQKIKKETNKSKNGS